VGANSGEISFYKSKRREKHISTKTLIGKYQISNSRRALSPTAPSATLMILAKMVRPRNQKA